MVLHAVTLFSDLILAIADLTSQPTLMIYIYEMKLTPSYNLAGKPFVKISFFI